MTAKQELYDTIRDVLDEENHPFAHDTTNHLVEVLVSRSDAFRPTTQGAALYLVWHLQQANRAGREGEPYDAYAKANEFMGRYRLVRHNPGESK